MSSREVARRERELRHRIGAQVEEIREDLGVSRAELADAVGVHRSHILRVEQGLVAASHGTLISIAAALGADLGVRFFPGVGPHLRDRFQAPIVEALLASLDPSWTAHPEVAVGSPRRGVIDVVLARGRLAIACEVQSELRRLEEALRRAGEKERALAADGAAEITSRLLVIRSTVATREVARRYAATLAAAYPAPSADAFDALTRPDRSWPGPAILWVRLEAGQAEILRNPPRGVVLGR